MASSRACAVVAFWAALCVGCGATPQRRYEEGVARAPAPAAHGIHSQRLRELMRGLERLQGERLPQALDVNAERELRVASIVEIARAMARSAVEIERAPIDARLDPLQRLEFERLARQLGTRSERLARETPRLSIEAVAALVEDIEETCAACHRQFRVPGAPRAELSARPAEAWRRHR